MGHTSAEIAEADRRFADWMRGNLGLAAEHLAVTVTGDPVFGSRMRSIGAKARDDSGGDRWLRVVSEFPQWAHGQFWTGNADANDLPETISRPRVLGTFEWEDGRCQRAELSTLLPGHPCSNTDIPATDEPMPFSWWSTLRNTLATLAATSTSRVHTDQDRVTRRIREDFGEQAPTHVERWETVHGDLHWNNLLCPEFGLLSWEAWGRGPAGTDAATLLCCSLLAPTTYLAVLSQFRDVLDTSTGRVAQLYAAARLLLRAERDQHHEAARALRIHGRLLAE
ncbi:aminoglycoside phosphotransferase [Saccharopolyspora endophytica]|uniref:Aminoglycoside phosphotransferase n=1 Tax=Saccharopolyspora endophytica TaxID=543886 RepID=A0ABS5DKJ5_9PSEU|nr:aminoglycoside phosphotransferase [Saccharopolyspora endophytica]MBQ0926760.1 aminoglycoside phosphotransferase [Saccharopolyspora endophytica]